MVWGAPGNKCLLGGLLSPGCMLKVINFWFVPESEVPVIPQKQNYKVVEFG